MEPLKNIVVTGGSGYIGSHTVVELIKNGFDVHIIDNLSNSDESMIDRIFQITGTKPLFTNLDLRNKKAVLNFFERKEKIGGIIHFAALKSVGESVNEPLRYYENNVTGFTNLLLACAANKITNLVFSSSCTVYGAPE